MTQQLYQDSFLRAKYSYVTACEDAMNTTCAKSVNAFIVMR